MQAAKQEKKANQNKKTRAKLPLWISYGMCCCSDISSSQVIQSRQRKQRRRERESKGSTNNFPPENTKRPGRNTISWKFAYHPPARPIPSPHSSHPADTWKRSKKQKQEKELHLNARHMYADFITRDRKPRSRQDRERTSPRYEVLKRTKRNKRPYNRSEKG